MFYEPELYQQVYEKYIEGIALEDILHYVVYFTKYDKVSMDDIEEMIDFMNKFL